MGSAVGGIRLERKEQLLAQSKTDLIVKALSFAANEDRHERRKGSKPIPYINHPIAVADSLVHTGNITDPRVIATAFLHDTIEDTRTTKKEPKTEFGAVLAELVAELSDDKSLLKEKRKRRRVERAAMLSPRARIVKLADKTCSLLVFSLKFLHPRAEVGKFGAERLFETDPAIPQVMPLKMLG